MFLECSWIPQSVVILNRSRPAYKFTEKHYVFKLFISRLRCACVSAQACMSVLRADWIPVDAFVQLRIVV